MSSNYIRLGKFEYNPADILGSGAFAVVYKGRFRNDKSRKVAIKQMIKNQNVDKSKSLLSKEISVLADLNHEHIVRLYDHCVNESDVYLVMEFCNGGDLNDYLHRKKTLPEETIRHFLIQIGSAMDAMNRKAIVHRDLKPGNILLSYYGNYASIEDVPGPLITFKLADFGFARFLQYGIMAQTMCGSPMYMAPEVLMCQKYDARADIWSMGIIVYQCYVGKAPFIANSPEALKNIYLKTVDLKPKIPSGTSPNLRDLLLKMLVRKASDRIDFPSFLSHPFLTAKHVLPSDLVPQSPATVPPLPNSARRLRGGPLASAVPRISNSPNPSPFGHAGPRRTTTDHLTTHYRLTSANAIPGSSRSRGRSTIADFMPTGAVGRGPLRRIGDALGTPRTGLLPPPPPPPPRSPLDDVNIGDDELPQEENFSEASLTPTEGGDEFIEDGLGGSSFLGEVRRPQGFGALDPCPPEVLKRSRPLTSNISCRYQPPRTTQPSMDKSLDGYVIVESDGVETMRSHGIRPSPQHPSQLPRRSDTVSSVAYQNTPALPSTDDKSHIPRKFNSSASPNGKAASGIRSPAAEAHFGFDPKSPSRQIKAHTHSGIKSPSNQSCIPIVKSPFNQISNAGSLRGKEELHIDYKKPVNTEVQMQAVRKVNSNAAAATACGNKVVDERLMEEHNKEMETMTMVLELCELLTELAERRASALTDCTTTKVEGEGTSTPSPPPRTSSPSGETDAQALPTTKLKLVPEAERIVEQLVLYRRILYYLEYVFGQVKKAVEENRMQPTTTAKKRLQDCNTLYHRCFIRLCQLRRLSRREDLLEPIGRHLSRITANRLIFNYALDQCFAAEMDDYIGELGLALQRYRAAIILIHGLCQHATTDQDKSLLAECLRMVQNRHATLFNYVASGGFVGAFGSGHEGDAPEPFQQHQQPSMPSENPTAVDCISW
nr:serine:threonine protein kinase ULK2 [Hymenolepis microstoma]